MILPDVIARPLRIQYPGAVYHVMNRGSSRQRVFLERRDCEAFLNTVGELHDRWLVEVWRVTESRQGWTLTQGCAIVWTVSDETANKRLDPRRPTRERR